MNDDLKRPGARLEMDPEADTVIGTITDDDGVERQFSGWMELANAIEAWRTANSSGSGGDTTPSPPGGSSRR